MPGPVFTESAGDCTEQPLALVPDEVSKAKLGRREEAGAEATPHDAFANFHPAVALAAGPGGPQVGNVGAWERAEGFSTCQQESGLIPFGPFAD